MPAGVEGRLYPGSVKVVIHRPIEGNDANMLCKEAREKIADTLVSEGYKIDWQGLVWSEDPNIWTFIYPEVSDCLNFNLIVFVLYDHCSIRLSFSILHYVKQGSLFIL